LDHWLTSGSRSDVLAPQFTTVTDRRRKSTVFEPCLSGYHPREWVGECRRLCARRRGASCRGGAGVTHAPSRRAPRGTAQPPTHPVAGASVAAERTGQTQGLAGAYDPSAGSLGQPGRP
jgi:hypothetical protein